MRDEISAFAEMKMKLKICGMKYNTQEVAALQPDYLGFIFYDKSKRDFEENNIPDIPEGIKKVGVFVDAELAFAKAKITTLNLDVIQFHGSESPTYIKELKNFSEEINQDLTIWKVFGIKDHFDFDILQDYEGLVDAFLFDTKGKEKGGNGYTFDWSVLKEYPSKTPFILSGGIGLEEVDKVKEILSTDLPIIALDVNSKFEDKPGLKNIEKLKKFKLQTTFAKAEDLVIPKRIIIDETNEQFYFYMTTNTYNKVLYTGFTVDLNNRIEQHKNKTYKGSFTARYNLDKLVYFETFKTISEARAREKQVKKWNREWKDNLINEMNPDWKDLSWML